MLLLGPSDRQSGELAAQVFGYSSVHCQPIGTRKRTELQQHLISGDRVIALPTNEKTIRRFLGARLLVVDETSCVSDALYPAVRPLLAVSRDVDLRAHGEFTDAHRPSSPESRVPTRRDEIASKRFLLSPLVRSRLHRLTCALRWILPPRRIL